MMDEKLPNLTENNASAGRINTGFTIDYRRILYRALGLWYVVVASAFLGLVIAYLTNRYTTRIYPITTSIMIRESAENSDGQFLYNNALVNGYRNFYNELYIIKSYPLIQSVIESLNFQVSIQKEGNIKSTEQYSIPIEIDVNGFQGPKSFSIAIISSDRFKCIQGVSSTEHSFGDSIDCSGQKIRVRKSGNIDHLINEQYLVTIRNPQQVAGQYISRLSVSWAQQGSSVVNLDINGAIPEKGIDFLNKLTETYQKYDLDKKNQAASRSLNFIDEQMKQIGDSLEYFENSLETFKKNNFVVELSAEAQQLYDELKLLNEQKSAVVFAVNYYNYLDDYLKKKNDYAQIILPSSIGVTDDVLNTMVNQLVTLQTELNLLPGSKGLQNPMIDERAAKLGKAVTETRSQIAEAINTLRSTDKIKIIGIEQQTSRLTDRLSKLPGIQRKLVNIQRNYTFNENMYNFLQEKKGEAGISKASTTSDIIVINPPRLAGGAITPQVSTNYAIGVVAGILIPFLIFILLELLNTKIQSKEDIEKISGIPFIGGIGHNPNDNNLVVFKNPKSAMAESFRALRSSLNYFTEGKDRKVIMITSSLSGEGKSFTTINLATVFSLAGKKTIIVGADLRKPKMFEDFDLGNEKGLSTYLSGMVTLDEIIQQTTVDNLDLISGGPVPPNPSELLMSQRMEELIVNLKTKYDYVLMDTPPLSLITDGLVLSKFADHTIFIVRQNYTPRAALGMVEDIYQSGKIAHLSLVLNDVYRTGPGYGYGGYGYGYGYGGYGYGYTYFKKGNKNGGGYYS